MTLSNVDQALVSGARLCAICDQTKIAARTLQRWRLRGEGGGHDLRRGPKSPPRNALSKEEVANVLAVANSPENRDLSPRQIVPRLADEGIYIASESTFYRVLEKHGQNSHRGPTKPRTSERPAQRVATGPGQLLCWDITYLPTTVRGRFFYLYLYLDVWSRKIVGWGVNEEQCGAFAADLLQASCDRLGRAAGERVLHSDKGKPMKGSSMLAMMQTLGIVPSFSRPHVSDDNPYIESIFRTLKYRPGEHGTRFDTVQEAADWVRRFVRWYNHEHLHSGIGFVTPADRHEGRDIPILEHRRALYGQAQSVHPERWTRSHRAWKRPSAVLLLPNIQALKLDPTSARVA
jgi:putative transposase